MKTLLTCLILSITSLVYSQEKPEITVREKVIAPMPECRTYTIELNEKKAAEVSASLKSLLEIPDDKTLCTLTLRVTETGAVVIARAK